MDHMSNSTCFNIDKFELIIIEIPKDGSCLFHALLLAFFNPYITENFKGNYISRNQIVSNLRTELSEKLAKPINGKYGKTYYETLHNGQTIEFSKHVPEFSLRYMQYQLRSKNHIGYGFLSFISDRLNKDIFILDSTGKIYVSDEVTVKGRNAIVLYYNNNHYELIGLKCEDYILTHFKPDNEFIKFLKK